MARFNLLAALSAACATASALVPRQAVPDSNNNAAAAASAPTVDLKNGSYYGVYSPSYDQDFFLGMPYARPPVDDLRFRVPQPLNSSWEGTRNATEYSPLCFGYGSDTWVLGNHVSEDCLTINVVRPHGVAADAKLPVALWIHGGGLTNGGSADPRYNLSFIVDQGVSMGTPFVAASINYRLHAWGFLWSDELKAEGAGNLGFRDQRLALHWVRENIAAFGGDPTQVTLWGESAGARSVSTQMLAYGGRDDGLYRAAILQSGTGLGTNFGEVESAATTTWQDYYDGIVAKVNCTSAASTLACLRRVPAWDLSNVINATAATPDFSGVVDGDFLVAARHELVNEGRFTHVPLIIGTNSDEGTQFGVKGVNTTEQWCAYLRSGGAGNVTTDVLSALYPDIPRLGNPAVLEGRPTGADAWYGAMWKRVNAFAGDRAQHAPRRLFARRWAAANQTVYSYNFNVLVNGLPPVRGVDHFQEVAFVFDNTGGLGYETAVAVDPFQGKPETYKQLAGLMSRMWVAFIAKGDPNRSGASNVTWPAYRPESPEIISFDANVTSLARVLPDTYRTEQMEYLIQKLWS
ncbi:carboxylesterase [Colletotrichum graminicola]|uniref:Carboxylic ester hydrolase n=1 Tax=Colletotrichum graminicola (strain M1.001 / M2 / FGSC 10212) TaxID=645133 RepID=E3Q7I4_COLGM|nr:carboxylesterase [Colletotrichum graminicola M1.001]EFQ26822.1 carboxylesterase [Colletotrichum graminicola M1.001]WDK17621.1 carboxylesterase [Colletotrichum graminicola]